MNVERIEIIPQNPSSADCRMENDNNGDDHLFAPPPALLSDSHPGSVKINNVIVVTSGARHDTVFDSTIDIANRLIALLYAIFEYRLPSDARVPTAINHQQVTGNGVSVGVIPVLTLSRRITKPIGPISKIGYFLQFFARHVCNFSARSDIAITANPRDFVLTSTRKRTAIEVF